MDAPNRNTFSESTATAVSRFRSSRIWHHAKRLFHFQRFDRVLAPMLILVGLVLLGYVGLQYGEMYSEQRHLSQQWQQQNQTGATPQAPDDGLIKVIIPKINLEAIVVEGTTRHQLLLGPGHMAETAAPGEIGNSVITAHRDTFFRHIYELNKGDAIEIRRSGKLYTYVVTGKKVIDPEDLSVVRQSKDRRLTLITCYPTYYIGPAPDRLAVFAKMADAPTAKPVSGPEKDAPASLRPAGH